MNLESDSIARLEGNVRRFTAFRLFYTARHPKGSDNWYAAVVMGTPLKFDDVEPMRKSTYTSNREVNAFTIAGVEAEGDRQPQCQQPSRSHLSAMTP